MYGQKCVKSWSSYPNSNTMTLTWTALILLRWLFTRFWEKVIRISADSATRALLTLGKKAWCAVGILIHPKSVYWGWGQLCAGRLSFSSQNSVFIKLALCEGELSCRTYWWCTIKRHSRQLCAYLGITSWGGPTYGFDGQHGFAYFGHIMYFRP